MAVLVRYQPSSLSRSQYDQVNEALGGQGDEGPPQPLRIHVLFGDEGALRVSEIWDSEEQWRAFTERLLPVVQEVGVRMAGEPEVFEVHELQKR